MVSMKFRQKVTFKGKEYVVREVEEEAFRGVNLKEVIVPDTVVTIGDFAFSTSTLKILSLGLKVKRYESVCIFSCFLRNLY